jgi:hypothetical protein
MNILKYRYTLIFLIGFILVIIGIWLSFNKQPVLEGLADTSLLVLAGVDQTGNIYIANTGLAIKPEWTLITGRLKQFTGSLGQIVGVTDNNSVQYGIDANPYTWQTIPGTMRQVDFDYPMVTGVSMDGTIRYIDNIVTNPAMSEFRSTTSDRTFKWINVSLGRGYGISTENEILYSSNVRTPIWIDVTNNIRGKTFIQVSYDGNDVAVIDSNFIVYYANSQLETTPIWITLNPPSLNVGIKQITLKNNILFGIGTNNSIYFSPSQIPNAAWTLLTNTTTMTYIDCFYPRSTNMLTQRSVTSSILCNSNETYLNGLCISKCPDGTYPNGELCITVKKKIPPPATIRCTSSLFGNVTKWFCESETAAANLVKDPSLITTYVEMKDEVCVTNDPTTKMYFCQSVADIRNNTGFGDKLQSDYYSTCDNVKKNYFDLSNNLTSLILIQSGMGTGRDQLAGAKTALNNIYTSLICDRPSSPQVSAMCTQIQTGANAIGSDSTSIGTVLTNLMPSIQAAVTSRNSLLASITKFQCSL